MILNFIYNNFGLIEYIACTQLVVLLAAAFFYQVAKIIARTDRQDPLVKFYRVFWRSFFTGVTPMRELDMMQIEMMAKSAGIAIAGDLDHDQLARLDATDLGDLDSLHQGIPEPRGDTSEALDEPPATVAKAIGRTGPEDEDRIRPVRDTESRESKFSRKQRELKDKQQAGTPAPKRGRAADEEPTEVKRAATSRIAVRIVAFSTQDKVVGFRDGEVIVNVVYAPEDGHANGVIINLVADQIGVRPYQISLTGGHYKVRKTLIVAGLDQPTLDDRLMRL